MQVRRSRSNSPNKLASGRTPLQSKNLNTISHSSSSNSLLKLKSGNNSTPDINRKRSSISFSGENVLKDTLTRSRSSSPTKRSTPSTHAYNSESPTKHSLTSLNDPLSLSKQYHRSNSSFSIALSEKSPVLSSNQIPVLDSSASPSSIASLNSNKESPTKKRNITVRADVLPFKIFEDPPVTSPRSGELISNFKDIKIGKLDILQEQDENVDISNLKRSLSPSKEDRLKNKSRKALNSNHRQPLGDLDIRQFPGFIQPHDTNNQSKQQDSALQPKHQLKSSWMINFDSNSGTKSIDSLLNVPSFVTPPKDKSHYKYISSLDDNSKSPSKLCTATSGMKRRQHSFSDDVDMKSVKKSLKFNVYDDMLDKNKKS